jgi:hypothetical protein
LFIHHCCGTDVVVVGIRARLLEQVAVATVSRQTLIRIPSRASSRKQDEETRGREIFQFPPSGESCSVERVMDLLWVLLLVLL